LLQSASLVLELRGFPLHSVLEHGEVLSISHRLVAHRLQLFSRFPHRCPLAREVLIRLDGVSLESFLHLRELCLLCTRLHCCSCRLHLQVLHLRSQS
jgi:hypothetical protein